MCCVSVGHDWRRRASDAHRPQLSASAQTGPAPPSLDTLPPLVAIEAAQSERAIHGFQGAPNESVRVGRLLSRSRVVRLRTVLCCAASEATRSVENAGLRRRVGASIRLDLERRPPAARLCGNSPNKATSCAARCVSRVGQVAAGAGAIAASAPCSRSLPRPAPSCQAALRHTYLQAPKSSQDAATQTIADAAVAASNELQGGCGQSARSQKLGSQASPAPLALPAELVC